MFFAIQVSNPAILSVKKKRQEDLAEALNAIFPDKTEEAYILWNWVPVRVSYKYDLSVMIEDILNMLIFLTASESGSYRVSFGSSTLNAEWQLNWNDNQLTIFSNWHSPADFYTDLLNSRNKLEINRDAFLWEWKAVLRKVIWAIENGEFTFRYKPNWKALYKLEAAIPKYGFFYQTEESIDVEKKN
jgi:hypothetical protein